MNKAYLLLAISGSLLLSPLASGHLLGDADVDINNLNKAKIVTQGKVRSDLDTAKAVKSAISFDRNTSSFAKDIEVVSDNGVVTLSGIVPTVQDKINVEAKAKSVSGVASVMNNLQVKEVK